MQVGDTRLTVTDGAFDHYPGLRDYGKETVIVGLRPEHFVRGGDLPEDQRMMVRAELVEALWSDVLVHFPTTAPPVVTEDMREAVDDADAFAEMERRAASGGQTFTARLEPKDMPKLNQELQLGFRTDELHFFDIDGGAALR